MINLPCPACERGDHTKCYGETAELKGYITRGKDHCSCLANDHKLLRTPRQFDKKIQALMKAHRASN